MRYCFFYDVHVVEIISTCLARLLGVAYLWEIAQIANDQAPIVSFTMLTVNADHHPVMNRFHKPKDEKRTPVVIPQEHFMDWLSADHEQAMGMLSGRLMPNLVASEFKA